MSDQQQWTPVPPPHPFPNQQPQRRGIAIATMAVGLVALLTTIVSAFYFNYFVLLGAVLGIAALGLGIAALIAKQALKGASITGIITGALSVLLAIATAALMFASYLPPGGSASESGSAPESEPWSPDEEQEQLISWPANMATAGLAFGPGGGLLRSSPLDRGETPAALPVARNGEEAAAPNDVLIYVDYRCPHCAQFEQVNGALLESELAAGTTTVEVKPLAFVDPERSAEASGAMACIADSQPESAWVAHQALLGPEAQASTEPGADALISLLDGATGGLNSAAVDCIQSERFIPFAQALSEWTLANSVPNAVEEGMTVSGTPTILVNGVVYQGGLDDAASFAAFYEEQTR